MKYVLNDAEFGDMANRRHNFKRKSPIYEEGRVSQNRNREIGNGWEEGNSTITAEILPIKSKTIASQFIGAKKSQGFLGLLLMFSHLIHSLERIVSEQEEKMTSLRSLFLITKIQHNHLNCL